MKKTLLTLTILAALAAGCAPKPAPVPTLDLSVVVGTMMAATLTAVAPTIPPPTNTPAPEPTPTQLPPGSLIEEFGPNFVFPNPDWLAPYDATDPTGQVKHNFSVSVDQDFLKFALPDAETYVYTFYSKDMPADIDINTSYKLEGKRNSEVAVVCRVDPNTRTSWYEFRINHFDRTGHIYFFNRVDPYNNPYNRLAYAKLSVELFADRENRIHAICKGKKLTLLLNDIEIVSVEDTKLPNGGLVGMGAIVHSLPPLTVSFNNLNVSPAAK